MKTDCEEILLKLDEILNGKLDPRFFIFQKGSESINEIYLENTEEIKSQIEQIIFQKNLNLQQLYDLMLVYFKDDILSLKSGIEIERLASFHNINTKNLRLLKAVLEITKDRKTIEKTVSQMSELINK